MATHNTPEDCWTVLRTRPAQPHPVRQLSTRGGDKILKAVLGEGLHKLFDKYHKWVNGVHAEKCKVGVLDTHVPGSDSENSEEEEEEEDFSFR